VTGTLPRHRKAAALAANRARGKMKKLTEEEEGWAQRSLREPRLGLAVFIGVLVGLPGASYVAALHYLIAGKYPTPTQVAAVIVFAIIAFLLIIVPWALLEWRPEGTTAMLRKSKAWLGSHARQVLACIAVILGAYLAISALVRLL